MNDDFLYDLRASPPAEFATRLKAQLERQTVEAQRQQRAFRWAAIAAMLVGSTALAFVSPTVRQTTLTMILQFRGVESAPPLDPRLQRLIEQKEARAAQRIMPDAPFQPSQPATPSQWSAASGRAASDAATFATRPEGGSTAGAPAVNEGAMVLGDAGARSQLRVGYSTALTAVAERFAAALERTDANLDVVLTKLAENPGVCTRGRDGINQDVWLQDKTVAGASVSCVGGERFIAVPLAMDAIVLVAHRENTWAQAVSIADLGKLRDRDATAPLLLWSQLRPGWPTLPIALVGTSLRDTDVGKRFAMHVGLSETPAAFVPTKDDRATLKYVEDTLGAIGYIDYATWYAVLRDRSASPAIVAITNEQGEPVSPDPASIRERRYPLSRPLWLYVQDTYARRSGLRPPVERLMHPRTLEESGLIPLGRDEQRDATRLLRGF